VSANEALRHVSASAHEEAERQHVITSAVRVLESLDPVPALPDEVRRSEVVLPGVVPLTPLTLLATCLGVWGWLMLEGLSQALLPDYRWPFMIAYAVLIGHIWSYHAAYHTRRQWMAARQLLLMTAITASFNWILTDLKWRPELRGRPLAEEPLAWAFWLNVAAVGVVWLHALALGRGRRRRKLRLGRRRGRAA
jgi:hypothetical protein